ncbi:hypothetical protein [Curtobacterium oceanosedimentum]|uniref:hypothetical protein n=1 Tax=Curtobacterium oceanosedimentum TaxID=465820 RepID=UPI0033944927
MAEDTIRDGSGHHQADESAEYAREPPCGTNSHSTLPIDIRPNDRYLSGSGNLGAILE